MTACNTRKMTMTAVQALQEAVREELEKKAKLGQQAVVCGKDGKPKVVSAKYLVRKMRSRKNVQA